MILSMAKLTLIILNYNTKELTRRAIESCLRLNYKDLAVIVVDNASSDGSVEELRMENGKWKIEDEKSRVKCIFLRENVGFAGGNNVALKTVTSEYVMLLNSDAYFPPDTDIESALDFMDQYPDVGMVSPHVELSSGKIDPACHRGFPTPWNAFCYYAGLERLGILRPFLGGYHQTWKSLAEIHDIDACTGAAMLIRRTAMDEVGLLDERFFMYGEDLDWCFRFKENDWRVIYFPHLTVIHDKHSSGIKKEGRGQEQEVRKKTKDAFYDAMKLFYKKHDLGPAWMENLILLGIHLLSKMR